MVLAGDERCDVGLAVKSGRGPLCVPDYTKPAASGMGWQYSQALATVLSQYKARGALSLVPDAGMTKSGMQMAQLIVICGAYCHACPSAG